MSEQQRREIPYTVVQSQSVPQCLLQSSNMRLEEPEATSPPRYDDLKMGCTHYNHPPIEDDTGSVVIV